MTACKLSHLILALLYADAGVVTSACPWSPFFCLFIAAPPLFSSLTVAVGLLDYVPVHFSKTNIFYFIPILNKISEVLYIQEYELDYYQFRKSIRFCEECSEIYGNLWNSV